MAIHAPARNAASVVLILLLLSHPVLVSSLDNGLILPPMGWSSWYGFTSHISESMIRSMADGLISSGLRDVGYTHVWIDDGWAVGRDNATGKVIVDSELFPSGMRNLSDYLHDRGLKFGIYTARGHRTCLSPDRPGSCGYEEIDAETYANDWKVDQVKDDGCGQCLDHDPFVAMRDALNRTGRPIWFATHACCDPLSFTPNVTNDWRVGPDLTTSSYEMWNDRLDRATTEEQRSLAGPGAFPNPDFLEVGYSPRMPKGAGFVQTEFEQRSMFTMWAMLPAPMILSADTRPSSECGGIDGDYTMETLTNPEVIAVNQDLAALPMRPIFNDTIVGTQVWVKPLAGEKSCAVVFFYKSNTSGPMPDDPTVQEISVSWEEMGWPPCTEVNVRDLWERKTLGKHQENFSAKVTERGAKMYKFDVVGGCNGPQDHNRKRDGQWFWAHSEVVSRILQVVQRFLRYDAARW